MSKAITIIVVFTFTVFYSGSLATAKSTKQTGQAIVKNFKKWMKESGVKRGSIAVGYEGDLIAVGGRGRKSTDPAPVASLSKAITANCVLHALTEKGGKASDTIAKWMPKFLAEQKISQSNKLRKVTIAQLITQSSGLRPDTIGKKLEKLRSFTTEKMNWQLTRQKPFKIRKKPGTSFFYNNLNYLLLGKLITELTGSQHKDYCFDQVLKRAGVSQAKLYSKWRVLSSYGGWQISAEDYLKFTNHMFATNRTMSKSPYNLPRQSLGNGAYYGIGTFFRNTKGGYNYWHFGRWNWSGRVNASFGAYSAAYANGFSVSANYEGGVKERNQGKLDQLLYRAAH